MSRYNSKLFLGVVFLLGVLNQSCGFLKSSSTKKGSYRIIKTELIDTGASIKCLIFDEKYGTPIEDVLIFTEDKQTNNVTKINGYTDVNIKPGKYKINVVYGNTRVITKPIKVCIGSRVVIRIDINISSMVCKDKFPCSP